MRAAFEELKVKFKSAVVPAYLDYEKPFLICTDATTKAVGAVLSKADMNRRDNFIPYASRALSSAESNYSAFEREALGDVFALKYFRNY